MVRFCFLIFASTFFVSAVLSPAWGLDVIVYEELKEKAVRSGSISQRFVTCKTEPPYSVRVAFLRYAKARGATPNHLDILSKYFNDGQARVRNLKSGFSEEECKVKLESPEGKALLEEIKKWGAS